MKYPGTLILLESIGNLLLPALNGLNDFFFSGISFKSIWYVSGLGTSVYLNRQKKT